MKRYQTFDSIYNTTWTGGLFLKDIQRLLRIREKTVPYVVILQLRFFYVAQRKVSKQPRWRANARMLFTRLYPLPVTSF